MAIKINGVTVIDDSRVGNLAAAVATGNVDAGNLITTGVVDATGNVSGGNITTAGVISAVGNISGNYFIGNGSQLSGIDATSIQNGTANVRTFLNANVTVSAAGTANVMTVTGTGANISGTFDTTGNANVGNLGTAGLITATGNVSGGNLTTAGRVDATGNVAGGNITTTGQVSATGNITGANLLINNNAVITGNLNVLGTETIFNVQTLTVNDLDIVVANNVTGGANINGAGLLAGNPTTASFVYNNATTSWQVNVALTPDANGTLDLGKTGSRWGNAWVSTLTSTGNANVGNLGTAGQIIATGNIQGNFFIGNGSQLTGIATGTPTKIESGTSEANIRSSGGNLTISIGGTANVGTFTSTGANISGTLNATGNANVGNLGTAGLVTATGNVTGGNINSSGVVTGNGRPLTNLSASNIDTGTLAQARLANASLTVNGTSIALGGTATVTANTTQVLTFSNAGSGGASGTTFNGGTAQTISYNSVGAPSTTGTNASGTWSINVTGSAGSATTAATVTTAAQPNITSVGTLSSLTVTGNVTGGNLITAGLVSLSSITKTGSNGVGNIGASNSTFNTIFAKATSAQYADLAEVYAADAEYAPGTVMAFGGVKEVTVSTVTNDARIAGVVSTAPSYIMNSALESEYTATVALTGRVPTRVTGTVRKGDMMVSAGGGSACACSAPQIGTVIGKALEDFAGESGVIEVVVGRL